MRQRNKRNIVIGLLCVMVVFMSVGYAILSQNLNINGTANITGSWKIEITDISPEEINEGKSVSTSIADSKVAGSFVANLKKPTDAVIYTVTVENKGTIDAVLESITPEDYSEGDIKYTTTGKEDCKNLDAGATCDFTIKVEYLDTGVGQQPTPNGTEVKQEFTIKYVQEGANVNIPGGGSGSGENPGQEKPAIIVDSNGKVIGYNKEKLTNDEGYVVIPATTETGEKIVSIDENSFVEYNVISVSIYDEITEEEVQAVVIYDEENYDAIEQIILSQLGGEAEATTTSTKFNRNINPKALIGNKYKNPGLQKLATNTVSGMTIYSKTEFDLLLKEMESIGTIETEYYPVYINLETGEFGAATNQIEKLDLTQAIHLKTIEEYAFEDSPLKEIKFSDSIEEIGNSAFDSTALTNIILPKELKTIKEYAFQDTQLSGTLVIPSTVTTIGARAFFGPKLTALIFEDTAQRPSKLTTIAVNAFSSNQISGTLIIPSTVTSIYDAFGSNQISEVIFEDTEENPSQLKSFSGFSYNQITEIVLPSSITTIGSYAFAYNDITGEVLIPSSVEMIGDTAFRDNQISTLVIQDTKDNSSKLTTIGGSAFEDNQISEIIIPEGVTTIGRYAFAHNQIVDLSILSTDITIESDAFNGENNSFTNVYLNMKNIGSGFCRSTTENLTIGADVETITSTKMGIGYKGAFEYCGAKKITFEDTESRPSKLTKIDVNTFSSSQISGDIIIPSSVTTIGATAFLETENLTKIIIKRADSNGMTLENNWNLKTYSTTPYTYHEIVYNPNYVG